MNFVFSFCLNTLCISCIWVCVYVFEQFQYCRRCCFIVSARFFFFCFPDKIIVNSCTFTYISLAFSYLSCYIEWKIYTVEETYVKRCQQSRILTVSHFKCLRLFEYNNFFCSFDLSVNLAPFEDYASIQYFSFFHSISCVMTNCKAIQEIRDGIQSNRFDSKLAHKMLTSKVSDFSEQLNCGSSADVRQQGQGAQAAGIRFYASNHWTTASSGDLIAEQSLWIDFCCYNQTYLWYLLI